MTDSFLSARLVSRCRELGEWAGGGSDDDGDDDQYVITEEDELPFACFICRDGFR